MGLIADIGMPTSAISQERAYASPRKKAVKLQGYDALAWLSRGDLSVLEPLEQLLCSTCKDDRKDDYDEEKSRKGGTLH